MTCPSALACRIGRRHTVCPSSSRTRRRTRIPASRSVSSFHFLQGEALTSRHGSCGSRCLRHSVKRLALDNRPSASGILGTDVAAKATADGYTLLFACASHTVKPAVDAKLPYNPEADLMAIILVGKTLLLLYVDSKVAARAGATSQAQLILALLSRMAGVRMQHIPYRGAGGDGDGSGRSRSLRPVASQAISNIATSLPSDVQPWVSMSRYSLPARDTGRRIMAIVV
jgi:hypothetical protein